VNNDSGSYGDEGKRAVTTDVTIRPELSLGQDRQEEVSLVGTPIDTEHYQDLKAEYTETDIVIGDYRLVLSRFGGAVVQPVDQPTRIWIKPGEDGKQEKVIVPNYLFTSLEEVKDNGATHIFGIRLEETADGKGRLYARRSENLTLSDGSPNPDAGRILVFETSDGINWIQVEIVCPEGTDWTNAYGGKDGMCVGLPQNRHGVGPGPIIFEEPIVRSK